MLPVPSVTPLAWLGLVHDRSRLVSSLAGVTFAVFIMFVEMGFLNGVYDSQTEIVNRLNADLVIVNRLKDSFLPTQPFSRRRLEQARAVPGVAAAEPLYVEEYRAQWKSLGDGRSSPILVIGFDPESMPLAIPGLAEFAAALALPDTALADSRSRDLFGPLGAGTTAELSGRTLQIAGLFELGPNFRSDGLLLMSAQNFLRYFPDRATGLPDPDRIELGLLRLERGVDAERVGRRLEQVLPGDVAVLSRSALAARVESFWRRFQPVGTVFGLGAAIGFVIGVIVCYQILFTYITDQQRQFATLKAMGYRDRYLVGVVVQKGLLLAVCGFLPGLLLAALVYTHLEGLTGIRMWLTAPRALLVLILTMLMCTVSAGFAIRRVLGTDPAELF